jgi:peptidoglycan hydrolase FlgJ
VKNLKQGKGVTMQIVPHAPQGTAQSERQTVLREKAQQLEATFLAEMLSHAGFGAARESFGGGIGEDQFASFLRAEQAAGMVRHGGIGLAEQIFRTMSAQEPQDG